MNKTSPGKQALSWLLAAAMSVSLLPVSAFAAEETADAEREDQQEESAVPIVSEDTEEDDAENAEEVDAEEYISLQTEDVPVPQTEEDRYYLMNIPYDEFYSAIGVTENSTNFDAITSATHKVSLYDMAGGSYHVEQTAEIVEDGTITAVGKDNDAKFGGVTWPVKVTAGVNIASLDGDEIEATTTKTIAANARGQTRVSYLYGYECLMEAKAYSYYQLDEEPDYYLELDNITGGRAVFSNGSNHAVTKEAAAAVDYSDRHCDVALQLDGVDDVADILVNAAVITASENGRNPIQVGLVHVHNIWRNTELGWNLDTFDILNGKTIESITYYCSVKDDNVDEGNNDAPTYGNYIYQYTLDDAPVVLDVESEYILMNIPYDVFYEAIGTTEGSTNFDAVSSATNKVGNYGKSGGSFHSAQSAKTGEDGSVIAVGGENGAKNEGVTWPVKIEGGSDVLAQLLKQGGKVITEDSSVTVATVGRGQTSSSKLVSYEALNEAPAYSYFFLNTTPDNYFTLSLDGSDLKFANSNSTVTSQGTANVTASYGTNWGDVQLGVEGVSDVEAALVNAVVISTTDGTQVPLVHLYNVWSAKDIAWRAATVSGLDGKIIQSITYYCSVKDDTVSGDNSEAPTYQNYIYRYTVSDLSIPPVYTRTMTAKFNSDGDIELTGLPENDMTLKAKVYLPGGRGQESTYLMPLEVDPADQDIDPVNADIVNGKITISSDPVTVANANGESKTYGQPVEGTEYTIEISSENWIINKVKVTYGVSYVLMNIPYSDFYAAELNNSVPVDAVTSATLNKPRTGSLVGGSYHIDAGGSDISGVTFPVKVGKDVDLSGYRQIIDTDSVEITVTNRGQESTETYSGRDALFESENYAYYVLNEKPAFYKELTMNGDKLSFGAVTGTERQQLPDASAEISSDSNYGDYQITIDDFEPETVYGVTLTTTEGISYGLRHLENIWRGTNLAFCTGFTESVHGSPTSSAHYESIMGQTIEKITYYTSNGIYEISTDLYIPQKSYETVTATVDGEKKQVRVQMTREENGSVRYDYSTIYGKDENDSHLVTIDGDTQLAGDTTLKRWVGTWESWEKYIDLDGTANIQYPYLDQVWQLAYDAYIAAFKAAGIDMSATMPDVSALKAYWSGIATTKGVEKIEVSDGGRSGYTIKWLDADGSELGSSAYTMTGKLLKGFEGAAAYVFTAQTW